MAVKVRPARSGDGEAIRDVFLEAGDAGWRDFLPVDNLAAVAPPAEEWEARISGKDGSSVLIAERDERLLGFAVVRPSQDEDGGPDIGELHALYVMPSEWGSGVMRELMGAVLSRIREAGFAEATLWAADGNRRACAAYASTRWRRDGAKRRRTHLGVEFDEGRYRIGLR
jgi:GNAT superfamily N-acetyltransferase